MGGLRLLLGIFESPFYLLLFIFLVLFGFRNYFNGCRVPRSCGHPWLNLWRGANCMQLLLSQRVTLADVQIIFVNHGGGDGVVNIIILVFQIVA